MANLTIWPVRYKPLSDELLSSWLVRIAHGHGLKVQTFCNLIFGNRLQVWNRDIDRLGPTWLIESLAQHTATTPERASMTTLRMYEGILYHKFKSSGHLQWLQSLSMYHRTREGYGQQFCPACLALDPVVYFRKSWRTAIKTMCIEHQCLLVDRCHNCNAAVSFHRIDMGKGAWNEAASMRLCHSCGYDLALTQTKSPPCYESREALSWLCALVGEVDKASLGLQHDVHVEILDLLHQLIGMMLSRRPHLHLNAYVADHIGATPVEVTSPGRVSVEGLPNDLRHQILLQGAWLMLDPLNRIRQAWQDKAVRYNHLVRDFGHIPAWYQESVINKIARRPYTHRKARQAR
jgi:hypothetical protein